MLLPSQRGSHRLLGNCNGQSLFDLMATLKASRPDLRIIVSGSGKDEETILKAIASGAKGYVNKAASPDEFVQAIGDDVLGLGICQFGSQLAQAAFGRVAVAASERAGNRVQPGLPPATELQRRFGR